MASSSAAAADDDVADEMMGALRLLFALEPACADAYFGGIAHELDALIETSAERIASPASWDVLCKLLSASARHTRGCGGAS